jgi:protein TonB
LPKANRLTDASTDDVPVPESGKPCPPAYAFSDFGFLKLNPAYQRPRAASLQYRSLVHIWGEGSSATPALATIARTAVKGACPTPFRNARAIRYKEPNYPALARALNQTGRSTVMVTLDADGAVADVAVYRSSGFASLDQAALDAARGTQYAPEIYRCKPVDGKYLFVAEFTVGR